MISAWHSVCNTELSSEKPFGLQNPSVLPRFPHILSMCFFALLPGFVVDLSGYLQLVMAEILRICVTSDTQTLSRDECRLLLALSFQGIVDPLPSK